MNRSSDGDRDADHRDDDRLSQAERKPAAGQKATELRVRFALVAQIVSPCLNSSSIRAADFIASKSAWMIGGPASANSHCISLLEASSLIRFANSAQLDGVKSSPLRPSSTSSGMPATREAITGTPSAIASMSTIGRPSMKLGSTRI